MADIISLQELADAKLDAQSLERFINGGADEEVLTRLSQQYPTIKKLLLEFQKYNGRAYKTYAEMDADKANLSPKTKVAVTNDTTASNNGDWQWDGVSFTKSAYDPLTQAKADATTKANAAQAAAINAAATDATTKANAAEANAKDYVDETQSIIDVSKLSGNYNLTLAEAIALVPSSHRKAKAIIEFNNSERFEFIGAYTEARFNSIRYWLRPSKRIAEKALNLFDEKMIYRGFHSATTGGVDAVTFAQDSAIAIIPIERFYVDGVLQKLNISTEFWDTLSTQKAGFMNDQLTIIMGFGGNNFVNRDIPEAAKYAFINFAVAGVDNTKYAKYIKYARQGYENLTIAELNDNRSYSVSNSKQGVIHQKDSFGNLVHKTDKDIFEFPLQRVNASAAAPALFEFITDIYYEPTRAASAFKLDGTIRKMFIEHVVRSTTNLTVRISVESQFEQNAYESLALTNVNFNSATILTSTEALYFAITSDGLRVYITLNPSLLFNLAHDGQNLVTKENAQVKPSYLFKRYKEAFEKKYDRFDTFEMSKPRFVSNYDYTPPAAKLAESWVENGAKVYKLTGTDNNAKHEQCALTAEKYIEVDGKKSITVFCSTETDATYSQAQAVLNRSSSGLRNSNTALGQYVHPDIVCIPDGFLGYKYWMINSHYPYGNPAIEDPEIFVSNDALNWERVLHVDEKQTSSIPLRIPKSYWDIYDPRNFDERFYLFMPIPRSTATMEFHTSSGIAQQSIKSILNHDPAISFQNGWLNFYVTYNFGLETIGSRHRYTVCYRTQDFVTWEVVREDGSSFVYDQTSAQTIFSSTNGVRNHIAYFDSTTATDASKQFVRVSDMEWYCYAVRSESNTTTLVRYPGTSPYQFDWNARQICTMTPSYIDMLWHICVQYISGKFYFMYAGVMTESTNGVDFINANHPFFHAGMQAEVYKPYFCLGHDGKIKVGASIAARNVSTEPHISTGLNALNKFTNVRYVPMTVSFEYPSMTHILTMGQQIHKDAFIDVVISINRERTQQFFMHYIPKIKGQATLKNIELRKGDYVRIVAYLNTMGTGVANFEGILIDER